MWLRIFVIIGSLHLNSCGNKPIKSVAEHSNPTKILETKVINRSTDSTLTNWPWRGISIVSHGDPVNSSDIELLAEQGVNFFRLRLSARRIAQQNPLLTESQAITKVLEWATPIIENANKHAIVVLLSMTEFPIKPNPGVDQTRESFWHNPNHLDNVLQHVRQISEYAKLKPNVLALEFFPEPVMRRESIVKGKKSIRPPMWQSFAKEIANTISDVDSSIYVSIAPGPWGAPNGYESFEPLENKNVIYSFHFYLPHAYTHQKSKKKGAKQYSYPGEVKGNYWDKQALEESILIAKNWCDKYHKPYLFAGEFSVTRRAEGKNEWMSDVLSIFEENHIGHAYFSYNGANVWALKPEISAKKANFSNQPDQIVDESKEVILSDLHEVWKKN